jgi:hypothetical protein
MLLRNVSLEKPSSTHAGTQIDLRNTPSFNILRANSLPAIFYADGLSRPAANSSILKVLRDSIWNFFNPDQPLQATKTWPARNHKLYRQGPY